MYDYSAETKLETDITAIKHGMNAPLRQVQKDETRFLYISLFLSVTFHIILFVFMAATSISHPFAGASEDFDLFWVSPVLVSSSKKASKSKQSRAKKEKIITRQPLPAITSPSSSEQLVKSEPQPPPTLETKSLPIQNPPLTPLVSTMVKTSEAPKETPSEIVITRFSGKVIEVFDKKEDVPTFTVMNSVQLKSKNTRTVVQTIQETDSETRDPQEARSIVKPLDENTVASIQSHGKTEKREGTVAAESGTVEQKSYLGIVPEKLIQGEISSSSISTVKKPLSTQPEVHESMNSLTSVPQALFPPGSKLPENELAPHSPANGKAASKTTALLQHPSEATTPARPITYPPKVKLAERQLSPDQVIIQPPQAGDLKLAISGDVDVTVETFFKPFPKNRRNRPLTKREAKSVQRILPKMIRTKGTVHEAIVEDTEEGIYSIVVRPNNGKQGTANLELKILESRPGSTTKNLGSRKIDGVFEVAKVLMPEGILWDDDKYFTGDMEDSDSITKFHAGTGLMWREYKGDSSIGRVRTQAMLPTLSGESVIADRPASSLVKIKGGIKGLPSFVHSEWRDIDYSLQHPGWERYVSPEMDFRICRENGTIKALQGISRRQSGLNEEFLSQILKQVGYSGPLPIGKERSINGFQITSFELQGLAELVTYHEQGSLDIKAFVLEFQ